MEPHTPMSTWPVLAGAGRAAAPRASSNARLDSIGDFHCCSIHFPAAPCYNSRVFPVRNYPGKNYAEAQDSQRCVEAVQEDRHGQNRSQSRLWTPYLDLEAAQTQEERSEE